MRTTIFIAGLLMASLANGATEVLLGHQAQFLQTIERPAPRTLLLSSSGALSNDEASGLLNAAFGEVRELASVGRLFSVNGNKQQHPLLLERIDLYAASAKIWLLDGQRKTRLQPSQRKFFIGGSRDISVLLAIAPDQRLDGMLTTAEVSYTISGNVNEFAIAKAQPLVGAEKSCGVGDDIKLASNKVANATNPRYPSLSLAKSEHAYTAVVAIDTDNEFLFDKFANNSGAATNWIEDLFLEMNDFYEPDLGLRLLIGDVFLRVDTTPAGAPDYNTDPATFNDGLSQFRSYWNANMGTVSRSFAALLAGKDISSNSFSGVAYVGDYCNSFAYSINRIGAASFIGPNFIAGGVGHELGHNLGSFHSHCERLKPADGSCSASGGLCFVDECYSGDGGGCYVGATSCPAVVGSLMSYCHAPSNGFDGTPNPPDGPPNNCQTEDSFNTNIAAKLIDNIVAAPSCFAAVVSTDPPLFLDGFESP